MKLTEWYPAHIKPMRVGIYETKHWLYGQGFRLWNGEYWKSPSSSAICNFSFQRCAKWRGVKK